MHPWKSCRKSITQARCHCGRKNNQERLACIVQRNIRRINVILPVMFLEGSPSGLLKSGISATRVIESSGDILLGAKQCEVREHVPRSEFRGFPCTLLLQKFSSNIPGLWNPGPPRRAYFPPHRCTSSNHREQVNEIMLLAFSRDSSRPGRKTTIWQIWQSSPNAVD